MKNYLKILIISLPFTLFSCATSPAVQEPTPIPENTVEVMSEQERLDRENLVACALKLIGQKPNAKVTVNGRNFNLDCTGTISAAYWDAGYDLQKDYGKYDGNGVNRIYKSMKDWGSLHELRIPKSGDVIFWSNTYDRNENGILDDDGLTHAGLVIKVEDDGTVHYLHESYTRGVVIAYFNLLHPNEPRSPDGKIWNSPMYLGTNYDKTTNPPHWLSGDLWSAFGDANRTIVAIKTTK